MVKGDDCGSLLVLFFPFSQIVSMYDEEEIKKLIGLLLADEEKVRICILC